MNIETEKGQIFCWKAGLLGLAPRQLDPEYHYPHEQTDKKQHKKAYAQNIGFSCDMDPDDLIL